jgi:acyl carrier protein
MNPILDQLNVVFRDVFENPSLTVQDETTARDVNGWDSLMHIHLIVAVERKFGIRFGTGEVEKLQNVGDMVRLITSRKGAA